MFKLFLSLKINFLCFDCCISSLKNLKFFEMIKILIKIIGIKNKFDLNI